MATIKALTKEHVDAFKRLGRQDHSEALIVLKLFLPSHNFYWYLTELETDPNSEDFGIGFGFCDLNDPQNAELGSVDIFELLNLNRTPQIDRETCKDLRDIRIGGPGACWRVVERDIHYPVAKTPISEVISVIKMQAG
jgi:hypothetical protein